MNRAAVVTAIVLSVLLRVASALATPRDPAQEAAIDQAVSTVDPALVALVHEGNDAMDRNDPVAAVKAYGVVHEKVPAMVDITRRLGVALARAGDVTEGERLCRVALHADGSAENHAALASVLMFHQPPSQPAAHEALNEAKMAARLAPNAEYAQLTLCQVATLEHEKEPLADCSGALARIAPNAPETHAFGAMSRIAAGDYDGADKEIAAAAAVGLPEPAVAQLREQLAEARPVPLPLRTRIAQWTATSFVASLFLIVMVGLILADTAGRSTSMTTRRVYGAWLVIGGLFFYVFVAVLLAALVLLIGAGIYLFVVITTPPLAARVVGGIIAAYVLFALVRASLASTNEDDQGVEVDLRRNGRLKDVLDAVTRELGQPPIARVRVMSDASFDVTPRDGTFELRLGAFALEGLSRRAFEALVARGVARFSGPCAKGLAARERLDALARRMEVRGVAVGANPAWWLVGAYRWLYARMTDAAVDIQTRWASEQASRLFGSKAVIEGLEHVVRREVELEARRADIVREAIAADAPAKPVTTFADMWAEHEDEAAHVSKLTAEGRAAVVAGAAWDLFEERREIESATVGRLAERTLEELGLSAAAPAQ